MLERKDYINHLIKDITNNEFNSKTVKLFFENYDEIITTMIEEQNVINKELYSTLVNVLRYIIKNNEISNTKNFLYMLDKYPRLKYLIEMGRVFKDMDHVLNRFNITPIRNNTEFILPTSRQFNKIADTLIEEEIYKSDSITTIAISKLNEVVNIINSLSSLNLNDIVLESLSTYMLIALNIGWDSLADELSLNVHYTKYHLNNNEVMELINNTKTKMDDYIATFIIKGEFDITNTISDINYCYKEAITRKYFELESCSSLITDHNRTILDDIVAIPDFDENFSEYISYVISRLLDIFISAISDLNMLDEQIIQLKTLVLIASAKFNKTY